MGVKADILDKKVVLFYISDIGELIRESYDKCRFFRGTHSIKKEDYTYYCRGDEYYACFGYCLVVNLESEKKAIKDFYSARKNRLEFFLSEAKKEVSIYEEKLKKNYNAFNY